MLAVRLLPPAFSLDREDDSSSGGQDIARIAAPLAPDPTPLSSLITSPTAAGRAFLVLMGFSLTEFSDWITRDDTLIHHQPPYHRLRRPLAQHTFVIHLKERENILL